MQFFNLQLLLIGLIFLFSCNNLKRTKMTSQKKNLHCDINTGVCSSLPQDFKVDFGQFQASDKVKIIYFTDPICSACWAIEPQLRKFKFEYGQYFDLEYRLGGLLPSWDVLAQRGGGIRKPEDVAPHWEHMGKMSGMSMDGDIWYEDPLDSSYPPSLAYKAALNQGKEAALLFMRKMRELLFLEGKNITHEVVLLQAAKNADLDEEQWLKDYKSKEVQQQLEEDLTLGASMSVRGFPSFYFVDAKGNYKLLYGVQSYENFEKQLLACLEPTQAVLKNTFKGQPLDLFNCYSLLNSKELQYLTNWKEAELNTYLSGQVAEEKLIRKPYKFGDFYELNCKE